MTKAASAIDGLPVDAALEVIVGDVNHIWMLVCGMLVFLMQFGFCLLEAGAVRSQNVASIIYKNFADCCIGALMWWTIGYSLGFGEGNLFIGGGEKALWAFTPNPDDPLFEDLSHFFLTFTHMTTVATIVSGSVAERVHPFAYAGLVAVLSGFTYPVSVHWLWSDYGWLSPFSGARLAGNGVLDFAGGLVLHAFGGCAALVFAFLLGPRKLRGGVDVFSEEGQRRVAPHNKLLKAAGTLVVWFSWFAFNGGSVLVLAPNAIVTTLLSGISSTLSCMVFTRATFGYVDICHCCNAALAGLVAVTCGCGYFSPGFAVLTGAVGFWFYYAVHRLRLHLRIDDVMDAGAVHFGAGIWGCVAPGLFADAERIRLGTRNQQAGSDFGLFLGGGGSQLLLQLLGLAVVTAWCAVTTAVAFFVLDKAFGCRVCEEVELAGLDKHEHGGVVFDFSSSADQSIASNGDEDLAVKIGVMVDALNVLDSNAADKCTSVHEVMVTMQRTLKDRLSDSASMESTVTSNNAPDVV